MLVAPVFSGYRLGTVIALATLFVATLASWIFVRDPKPSDVTSRASADLSAAPFELGAFGLTERSGRSIREADLAPDVWIAAFVFTRCPSSCPRISAAMKSLLPRLAPGSVRLVSFSVDPERDTPEVLSRYASSLGAPADRWWFLTGDLRSIEDLLVNRFHVPVAKVDEATRAAADDPDSIEDVRHSTRLALVDRGNRVVGFFDTDDPKALQVLLARARKLDQPALGALPTINASLNAASALLLLVGWASIRRGHAKQHAAAMIAALAASATFLTCYLYYHAQVGSVPFQGEGLARRVYFAVLGSHTVLAIVIVPLIVTAVVHAARKRFAAHARVTRVTLPLWLYVSITGVFVYLMLYHLDHSPSLG
jgi:protein SCO1/2/putative membrane protein